MSKRKAEDILSYYQPNKRFISIFVDCRSVTPLISSAKRKLQAVEQDPGRLQGPDCKRVESARRAAPPPRDRSACGDTWSPGAGAAGPRGTGPNGNISLIGTARRVGPPENAPWDDVSCQYNSFQFWRAPLPTVELAEIEDFEQAKIAEEMNCEDPEEAAEIEMELQN
ncbi:uncharacterized protein C9orf40-like [Heptranchias perlo]|uniref:uncharacterized protein C9orf40-like n=1 Tax=Heptranchias perlo TaxID=212740 RepID=UPI00355A2BFA